MLVCCAYVTARPRDELVREYLLRRYGSCMDLSPLQMVLIFAGIPLAFCGLMALAILAPSWTRAGSYRPGEPWNYEPIMITGSAEKDVKTAISATAVAELASPSVVASPGVGGASARW